MLQFCPLLEKGALSWEKGRMFPGVQLLRSQLTATSWSMKHSDWSGDHDNLHLIDWPSAGLEYSEVRMVNCRMLLLKHNRASRCCGSSPLVLNLCFHVYVIIIHVYLGAFATRRHSFTNSGSRLEKSQAYIRQLGPYRMTGWESYDGNWIWIIRGEKHSSPIWWVLIHHSTRWQFPVGHGIRCGRTHSAELRGWCLERRPCEEGGDLLTASLSILIQRWISVFNRLGKIPVVKTVPNFYLRVMITKACRSLKW